MAISRFSCIRSIHLSINSVEQLGNSTWSNNVCCTDSYCNFAQNISIFPIMILMWFPGDSDQFYIIKRKINMLKRSCKRDIKIYGWTTCQITFESIMSCNHIAIVFFLVKYWIFQRIYTIKNHICILMINKWDELNEFGFIYKRRIIPFKRVKNCCDWMKRKKYTIKLNLYFNLIVIVTVCLQWCTLLTCHSWLHSMLVRWCHTFTI